MFNTVVITCGKQPFVSLIDDLPRTSSTMLLATSFYTQYRSFSQDEYYSSLGDIHDCVVICHSWVGDCQQGMRDSFLIGQFPVCVYGSKLGLTVL